MRATLKRFTPRGDFVVVTGDPELMLRGVYIPQWPAARTQPLLRGWVVKCGPGDLLPNGKRAAMNVRVGDIVLYRRAPANELWFSGRHYEILHEEQHIVAVLEQE